jgi:putative phage-type endonuclease
MAISQDIDREAWLAERRKGIGGSDAAAVLGVHPFKTTLELWQDKMGEAEEIEVTGPMKRGIALEPIAADLYAEETGRKIRKQPLRRHSEHEFMIANVDRQIVKGGDVTETAVLEVKVPGLSVFSKVKAGGLPDYMTVQLMHYLGVTGYSWGSFALFNAERWSLIHFDLEADQEFIGTLIEKEEEFWTKYVLTGTPPPENGSAVVDIPEVEGELKTVDSEEWKEAAEQLREASALVSTATALKKEAQTRLKGMMTDQGLALIEVPDVVRIYWREQEPRVNWKETAEYMAKVKALDVDAFKRRGKATRSFRPYFLKQQEE